MNAGAPVRPAKERNGRRMIKQLINEDSYVQIGDLCSATIQLKIEGLNPAGSIKLKTAHALITDLENQGRIHHKTRLVESSSGNLGSRWPWSAPPRVTSLSV